MMVRSTAMPPNTRIVVSLALLLSACGRIAYDDVPQESHDAGADVNAPVDMPIDIGMDAVVDAGSDAWIDAPLDLGVDMPFVPGEITVTPTSALVTNEGGTLSATFSVALLDAPSGSVFISISSSDLTEGTPNPTTLAFTPFNFASPQTVTVTGADDVLVDGDVSYSVVIAPAISVDLRYSGLDAEDVTLLNEDDDVAGVTLNRTSGLVTSEAGLDDTFTVRLDTEPSADVTISFSSSDLSEGDVTPTSVTFTSSDWDTPRTITVLGVDDVVADGDIMFTVLSSAASSTDPSYNLLAVDDVSATNSDNETPGITVTPTGGLTTSEVGGTASFVLVLDSQPSADVSVSLSSDDTSEGTVSPVTLTFGAVDWNLPQMVTVTGVNDLVDDGDVAYHIVTAAAASADADYNGLIADDVDITNLDNDAASVIVTPTSGLVTTERGATASFTIVLTSEPTADVSVALSSSNVSEGTVSPSSVTFTSMNWMTPQMVTVTGADELVLDADASYSIITASPTSSDAVYAGLTVADVALSNQTWPDYIKASNAQAGDRFGETIALSNDGTTLVVGAPFEDSAATGINGNQSSNAAADSGAVYVFIRTGDTWTQEAYIKASNTQASDNFGHGVALSADGNTLVVGAPGEDSNATGINGNQANNSANVAGALYAFTRTAGVWTQQAYIKASNAGMGDLLGYTLALADDGNTLVATTITEDSDGLGVGAVQGNNFDNESGAAYVFVRSAGVWSQQVYIKDSMPTWYFGLSVALAADGNTLAVGAWGLAVPSDISVFVRSGTVWSEEFHYIEPDSDASVGFGVGLSADGNRLSYLLLAGPVRTVEGFTRSGTMWTATPSLSSPPGAQIFGADLLLAKDGLRVMTSTSMDASPATRLNGDESATGAANSGGAYVYEGGPGAWSQLFYVKASNTGAGDQFATGTSGEYPPPFAMSFDANVIAVGAAYEDSSATGVGGDQSNNSAGESGAVYVYR
ncbi:MAG: hypothetical protein IPK60_14710 [Sandaracinaceae bacterium]|nr:hypothetical protein [Sandaracinaceae bacterium]